MNFHDTGSNILHQSACELYLSGQLSVNVRFNFGRKGSKETHCLSDESCLKQGVSRPDGCFELSHLGLWSGDWYVRHQSLVRTPRMGCEGACSELESGCNGHD